MQSKTKKSLFVKQNKKTCLGKLLPHQVSSLILHDFENLENIILKY